MHDYTDMANAAVPRFLMKLWKLVENPEYNDLISWNPSGRSFYVFDQARFSKEILPQYFKHNNMASFIRQLNMYGFHKVVNIDHGGLKIERDDMEFQHKYFVRGQECLLELIKRKAPLLKTEEVKIKHDDVKKVLSDVKQLRGKQENWDLHLTNLKKENEALWREIASLRQKHNKQQKIVNKLIQFLVSLVQPRGSLPVKRKFPLMINDANHSPTETKTRRLSRQFSLESKQDKDTTYSSGISGFLEDFAKEISETNSSNYEVEHSGPIIHDITDTNQLSTDYDPLIPEVVLTESPDLSSLAAEENSNDTLLSDIEFSVPASTSVACNETELSTTPDLSLALNDPKALTKSEINDSTEGIQNDLDLLKDLFAGSSYHFDPNLLLGLLNLDGNVINIPDLPEESEIKPSNSEIMGNELIQYNPPEEFPSLLELSDDTTNFFNDFTNDSGPEQVSVCPINDCSPLQANS